MKEGTTSFSLLAAPLALAVAVVVCGSDARWNEPVVKPESSSHIVQAESVETAKELVEAVRDNFRWSDGFLWSDDYTHFSRFLWSETFVETASINVWVEPQ